ncbi:TPA: hypothetical protein ACPHWC_002627 [Pseudomonas aeruginosa]|uniref:hypothetical protein n=1 Tax=Pseudomonas TaxID=286 RepID=UPI0003982C8B|nr:MULTISPECIES: hypothetical protein [Pseudomonas]EQM69849.1 hypothetical protein L682_12310 [Pseudomonas alcaligenes OT 69]MDN4143612.1 hypothetical protein [Pseudomonas tohonis]ASJ88217.1 hypothetical protein PSA83_06083 [Pseudomonas aeruginosa]EKW4491943.1 hypothetical protein [Pseudomonas aeruginosa]EKY0074444.1 hypothetical protein [Pseudomonas aeruginosa]
MNAFAREILAAARQAPAIYFAPLLGAIQEVKAEWKRQVRNHEASSSLDKKR